MIGPEKQIEAPTHGTYAISESITIRDFYFRDGLHFQQIGDGPIEYVGPSPAGIAEWL